MRKGSKMKIESRLKISKSLIGNQRTLGYKHREESKIKISKASKGHVCSEYAKRKTSEANKGNKYTLGRKASIEERKKRSLIMMGNKNPLGSKRTLESRQKMMGKNNPSWKGGITPLNIKIRNSIEYDLWKKSVFQRDRWTCIWCGYRGAKIQADHIQPFSTHPELRFAIDNGRTLCVPCHDKRHNRVTKVDAVGKKMDFQINLYKR